MISGNSKIAIVVDDPVEGANLVSTLKAVGFPKVTLFPSSRKALEDALKVQYEVFVVRAECMGISGPVFVQKLRESMNYGLETYFFLSNKPDAALLNFLLEQDIPYILNPPFTQDRIAAKFQHMVKSENLQSDREKGYREAKLLFRNSLFEDSLKVATKTEEKFGQEEKLKILLGDLQLEMGNLIMARAHYQSARTINPKSILGAIRMGMSYLREKDYQMASSILDSLAEMNPHNISLLVGAGLSNLEVGNTDRAKVHLEKAHTQDEENKDCGEALARVYVAEGNYNALASTLKSSHNEKELVTFLNNAGIKLSKENDVKGAIEMYRSCLDSLQTSEYQHVILYNMGIGYTRLGNTEEARSYFQQSLDIKPNFEKSRLALDKLMLGKAAS